MITDKCISDLRLAFAGTGRPRASDIFFGDHLSSSFPDWKFPTWEEWLEDPKDLFAYQYMTAVAKIYYLPTLIITLLEDSASDAHYQLLEDLSPPDYQASPVRVQFWALVEGMDSAKFDAIAQAMRGLESKILEEGQLTSSDEVFRRRRNEFWGRV